MNYKAILFFLGIYSLLVAFFSILNILYLIYFDFIIGLYPYLLTFVIYSFIGFLFYYLGRHHSKYITLTDQIISIILSFIVIPILISIPYLLSSYDLSPLNSYFESVSGFTTTGFSIIENISNIDEPLLLWRSTSQWMGGLLFLLAVIGTIGSKQIRIKPAYLV